MDGRTRITGGYAIPLAALFYIMANKGAEGFVVPKGSTLSQIARDHKVSVETLASFNGINDPDKIEAGQYLAEPPGWEYKDGEAERVGHKGQTLYGFSKKWGCTIEDILKANPNISDRNLIELGQVIYKPGKEDALQKRAVQKRILENNPGLYDLIMEVAGQERIPNPRLLDMITMTESSGDPNATRYEAGFQRKYTEPLFQYDKAGNPIKTGRNRVFVGLYEKLHKENPKLSFQEYKKQLSTSVGLGQLMYLVAVELGYRGSFDGLKDRKTNLIWAARRVKAHERLTKYQPIPVAVDYNTGSPKGKAWHGHVERSMRNYKNSKVPTTIKFKADGAVKNRGIVKG